MQSFVDQQEIAGAVTMVVDRSSVLQQSAVGWADLAERKAMQPDAIFWIASMTKPITGAAVMMMVEEGKLTLDDPVSKHVPSMSQLKTSDGQPAVITVRQLLSHTSGMAELPREEAYTAKTLAEAAEKYSQLPVLFPPGSKWQYSQTSINTAARIVEIVSGEAFDAFLQRRIFGPLGMVDTAFCLTDAQAERTATAYRKGESGDLEEVPVYLLGGKSPTDCDRFPAANAGLFSTASDYAAFCQMLLGEGERDGVRILQPESVRTMRDVVTGDLATGFTPGNAWGIGVCVVREPQGVSESLSPGSFGHGGAYGTQAWIDPTKGRAYILMIQRSDLPNADASAIRRDFQLTASRLTDAR